MMTTAQTDSYEVLRNGAGYMSLRDRGWISIAGADRATFLQGLLTNDVVALKPGAGCYSACLTPQGRLMADMYVFADKDRLVLDVHETVEQSLAAHFENLIFSEDVTVRALGPELSSFGVHGPEAGKVVSMFTPEPEKNLNMYEYVQIAFGIHVGFLLRTDDLGVEGYRLVVPREATEDLAESLASTGASRVAEEAAVVVRIESGVPLFPIDMDTETLPLEAGIEDRAINFDKGCYVGQEVVIRILHRGQGRVARRLTGLVFHGWDGPDDLQVLRRAVVLADDEEVGFLTSAAISPTLRCCVALGYVHRKIADTSGRSVEITVDDKQLQGVVRALPLVVSG